METTSPLTGKNSKASQWGLTPPHYSAKGQIFESQSQNTEETAGANQLHFCRTLLLRKSQITNCYKLGIPSHTTVYHCIPLHPLVAYHRIQSYTIAYNRIPSHTIAYHRIPSYTIVYHRIPYPHRWKMTVPPPRELCTPPRKLVIDPTEGIMYGDSIS